MATVSDRYGTRAPSGQDDFIGSLDSGDPDWAASDTHDLWAEAGRRARPA